MIASIRTLPPLCMFKQTFQPIDIALLRFELLLQAANLLFERFDLEILPYNQVMQ